MNQARRLGKSLEDVYISKIYASDLKRAHWTALQIATQNKSLLARLEETASSSGAGSSQFVTPTTSRPSSSLDTNTTSTPDQPDDSEEQMEQEDLVETTAGPSSLASTDRLYSNVNPSSDYNDDFSCSSSAAASSPVPSPTSATSRAAPNHAEALLPKTVTTTNKLREQYFGLAEGQNWKTGFATSANSYHNRGYKFEQGESLEDVHARAQEILHRCVVPWLVKCSKQQGDRKEHVVLVAHGIVSLHSAKQGRSNC
jgi:broad specificity phosphatase PhoE